tara:strand:- start:3494 stop:3754 length:261 start_codon:yes stop_codon:yes gene_type:complete
VQALAAWLEAAAARLVAEARAELAATGVAEAWTGGTLLEAARDDEAAATEVEVEVKVPGHPTPGRAMSWAYTSRAKYCRVSLFLTA